MTWKQLKNYISKQDAEFLNNEVLVYDFNTGNEYEIDVTELLYSEDKNNDCGWVPYIAINTENVVGENQNGQTEETGFR
jgi:hypothetical protein